MKGTLSLEAKYSPAMIITDEAAAEAYLKECVEHSMEQNKRLSLEMATRIEKSNIGYWAGYYDAETRERVERLFKCSHPIFGAIAKNGQPTPEEAYKKGVILGKMLREHRSKERV